MQNKLVSGHIFLWVVGVGVGTEGVVGSNVCGAEEGVEGGSRWIF